MPELSPVEALYRDVVLDHYRRPRNRAPLESPQGSALVHNPVCGDQVRVEVLLEDGCIRDVSASSRGCSIAVAAASVMTELVKAGKVAAAAALHAELGRLVEGGPVPGELDARLRAFERLRDLPSRRRCALLPWEGLDAALRAASGEAPDRSREPAQ